MKNARTDFAGIKRSLLMSDSWQCSFSLRLHRMGGWIWSTVTQALNSQLLGSVTIRNVETFEKPPVWFTDGQITKNSALKFCEHSCWAVVVFFTITFLLYWSLIFVVFSFSFFTNVNKDLPACSVAPFMEFCLWGEFSAFFSCTERSWCAVTIVFYDTLCRVRIYCLDLMRLRVFLYACMLARVQKSFVCRGDRLLI